MGHPSLPRTLILDFFDSYTNNLLTLFTKLYSDAEVLDKVVVVKADHFTWDEFQRSVLQNVDCIILSPGPGRPDNPSDIGFALDLIRLHPLPILGICLGHQAIGVAFGAKIINTPRITHGHVIPVIPVSPPKGLFASSGWSSTPPLDEENDTFEAVVYNSLTVDPTTLPDELDVTAWSAPHSGRSRTIQGLAHKRYPIWGVQYHPESISSTRGSALLNSFLDAVQFHHGRHCTFPSLSISIKSAGAYRIASYASKPAPEENTWPTPPTSPLSSRSSQNSFDSRGEQNFRLRLVEKRFGLVGKGSRTQDVFEAVIRSRKGKERAVGEVWLDGQTPMRSSTSSLAAPSFLLTYSLAVRTISLHTPTSPPRKLILRGEETFWDWFAAGQAAISGRSRVTDTKRGPGWRGGWAGWFGYEMKEESLQGCRRNSRESVGTEQVDACWAWTDRVLERAQSGEWTARGVIRESVHDFQFTGGERSVSTESLVDWLDRIGTPIGITSDEFDDYVSDIQHHLSQSTTISLSSAASFPILRPTSSGTSYRHSIDACREYIRQGECYELTLTTSFTSPLPPSTDPFALYLRLRDFNPAYYSTYISFPCLDICVLSSSPERFLRIDREREVEMKPIKGTRARVKAGQCVCVPGRGCEGLSLNREACDEEARLEDQRIGNDLQADTKERAENLMIVDLIRSDLLSCCIPSTVTVPKLIALETNGVHNLVTTVKGRLAENVGSVEAVKRCFPPGSMTGAPKLRSVQLLEKLEDRQRRGIYSGALGYFSIDGSADLSVVIRTIVIEGNCMSLGAGGAITWLSDRDEEWNEVLTKVRSVVEAVEAV